MELKELLGEELFKQVSEKIGDNQLLLFKKDEKVIIDDGNLIPKYRIDELTEKNKNLQAQIDKADNDLKELQKKAVGNETLTTEIENLRKENKDQKKDFETAELNTKKKFAVQEGLLNAGVLDPEARKTLALRILNDVTIDKIELDAEGKIKGIEEIIKPIKENKVFAGMFGEFKAKGKDHKNGDIPDEWLGKNPFSKKTLNYGEQIILKRTKPELAKILEDAAEN